jgi:hypothetical protein
VFVKGERETFSYFTHLFSLFIDFAHLLIHVLYILFFLSFFSLIFSTHSSSLQRKKILSFNLNGKKEQKRIEGENIVGCQLWRRTTYSIMIAPLRTKIQKFSDLAIRRTVRDEETGEEFQLNIQMKKLFSFILIFAFFFSFFFCPFICL